MDIATTVTSSRKKLSQKDYAGRQGRDYSCRYLEEAGFNILERNWKCDRGEADIIASENGVLVFVEVKSSTDVDCGLPEETVTPAKRKRYENIALSYLVTHEQPSSQVRFDVIAIVFSDNTRALLRHHRDAFSSDH